MSNQSKPLRPNNSTMNTNNILSSAQKKLAGAIKQLKEIANKLLNLYKEHSSQKIRRTGRERIYKLKGYTTVAKINRKRAAERQQRFLRKLLIFVLVIIIIIVLFNIFNPFKDTQELKKILGIDSIDDLTFNPGTTTTAETTKKSSKLTKSTDSIISASSID